MIMALSDVRSVPAKCLLLLIGPPGAGKTSLSYLMALSAVAEERPVIYITTEQPPEDVGDKLREKGLVANDLNPGITEKIIP